SGLLVATNCMPTAPAAPVLLTTPTGFLSVRSSAAATGRAVRSATPPGGNGTTMLRGREGNGSWATAAVTDTARAATARTRAIERRALMHWLLCRRRESRIGGPAGAAGRRPRAGRRRW